tara:strand:- start:8073 stop:12371 length:4299 start_codon:yes stop_codon:yes gene_type:complete
MNDIIYYIDTAIDSVDWRNNENKIWYASDKNFVYTTVKITAALNSYGNIDKDATAEKAREKALDVMLERFQRDPNQQLDLFIPDDSATGNPAIYAEPIKIAGFRIYKFLFSANVNDVLSLLTASAIDVESPQILNPLGPQINIRRCNSTDRGWLVAKSLSVVIGYVRIEAGVNEEFTIPIKEDFNEKLRVYLSMYKDPGDVAPPESFFNNESLLIKTPKKAEKQQFATTEQEQLIPVNKQILLYTAGYASKLESKQEEEQHAAGFVAGVGETMDNLNSILAGKNTALEQLGLPKEATELLGAIWATPELESLGITQDWTIFGPERKAYETPQEVKSRKEKLEQYAVSKDVALEDAYKAFNYASKNKDLLSRLGLGGQGARCLDDLVEASNFVTDPDGILNTLYDRMINKLDFKVMAMVLAKVVIEAIPDEYYERNELIKCLFGADDFKKYLVCQIANSVNQIESLVNLIKQFVISIKNMRFDNILDPLKIEKLLKKLIMFAIISAVYLLVNFLLEKLGLDSCDLSLDKIDEFFALDCGSAGAKLGNIGTLSTLALLSDDAKFRKNVAEVESGIFAFATLSSDAINNFDDFAKSNIENFGLDISVDQYKQLVQAVDITFSRENLYRLFKGDTSRTIKETLNFIIEEFKIPVTSREAELLFKAAGTVLADEDFNLEEEEHPSDCDPVDKYQEAASFYQDLPAEAQDYITLETQKVVDTVKDICDKFDTPVTIFDILKMLFNTNDIPLVQEASSAALNYLFDSIDTFYITKVRSAEQSIFVETLGDVNQAAHWRAYQPKFRIKAEESWESWVSLGFNSIELTEQRQLSPLYKLTDSMLYQKGLAYGLPPVAAAAGFATIAAYSAFVVIGSIAPATIALSLFGFGTGAGAALTSVMGLTENIEKGDAEQMKKDFLRTKSDVNLSTRTPGTFWGSLGINALTTITGIALFTGYGMRLEKGTNFYLDYKKWIDFGNNNLSELDGKLVREHHEAHSWKHIGQNPQRESGGGFIFEKDADGIVSYKYRHIKKTQGGIDMPTYSFELLRDEPVLKVKLSRDIIGVLTRPPIWKNGELTDEVFPAPGDYDPMIYDLFIEPAADKNFGDWKPLRQHPLAVDPAGQTFIDGDMNYDLQITRRNVNPEFAEPSEGKIETEEKFATELPEAFECRTPFKTFEQWFDDKITSEFGSGELSQTFSEDYEPLVPTPTKVGAGLFHDLFFTNIHFPNQIEVSFEEWVCGSLLMFITPYQTNYTGEFSKDDISIQFKNDDLNNYVRIEFDPFAKPEELPKGLEVAGLHKIYEPALKQASELFTISEEEEEEGVIAPANPLVKSDGITPNCEKMSIFIKNPVMRKQRYNHSIGIVPEKYVQTEVSLLEEAYKFEPFYMQEEYYANPLYTKSERIARRKLFEEQIWKDILDVSSIKSSVFNKLRNNLLKLKGD